MTTLLSWVCGIVLAAVGLSVVQRADAGAAPAPAPPTSAPESSSPPVKPASRPAQGNRMSVVGEATIDPATIRRVLAEHKSPAVDEAETIYELGRRYGIDPAFCLAFFIMESSAGTAGVATVTRSVGNIRVTPGYENYQGYRKYASWRDGIEDWYQLIARLYVGEWNLTTVEEIIPVYAPAEDNNDPARYIGTVRNLVNGWRAIK